MKKILVNGLAIQNEKGDTNKEFKKWQNKMYKVLDKHNLNNTNIYVVNYNDEKRVLELDDILDHLASKNLGNIILSDNNTIVFENEYGVKIEVLKEITKNEYYEILESE
jgi:hypothetical protein